MLIEVCVLGWGVAVNMLMTSLLFWKPAWFDTDCTLERVGLGRNTSDKNIAVHMRELGNVRAIETLLQDGSCRAL